MISRSSVIRMYIAWYDFNRCITKRDGWSEFNAAFFLWAAQPQRSVISKSKKCHQKDEQTIFILHSKNQVARAAADLSRVKKQKALIWYCLDLSKASKWIPKAPPSLPLVPQMISKSKNVTKMMSRQPSFCIVKIRWPGWPQPSHMLKNREHSSGTVWTYQKQASESQRHLQASHRYLRWFPNPKNVTKMMSRQFLAVIRMYIACCDFRILCHKNVYCLVWFQDPLS
jgi:hypothetical protein